MSEVTLFTHDHPDFPPRTHVPHMEGWAYNQMPKHGFTELQLYRYDRTDLYQWYGKPKGGLFSEAQDSPFMIRERVDNDNPNPLAIAIRDILNDELGGGGGCVDGHEWDWDDHEFGKVRDLVIKRILETMPADMSDVLTEARKWIAGQPHTATSKYETKFAMLRAIDTALKLEPKE